MGQNGYYKLPDGLLIQWGYSADSGSSKTIYLPVYFYDSNYSVITNVLLFRDEPSVFSIHIRFKYTSNFIVKNRYHNYNNTAGDARDGFHWIAIGVT